MSKDDERSLWKWHKPSEKLPRGGQRCLISCTFNGFWGIMHIAEYDCVNNRWDVDDYIHYDKQVDYWMGIKPPSYRSKEE